MTAPATDAATAGVRIRGLRKRYGDTVALAGLDIDARPGEILGVAGPNGAGKSTMVKILAGEVDRDEGEILVDGTPWSAGVGSHRVAVVHQEPQLFPNLTVAENVLAGYETRGWRWPRLDPSHATVLDHLAIDRSLGDVALGCRSVLELTYLRDVERMHGLPRAQRHFRR